MKLSPEMGFKSVASVKEHPWNPPCPPVAPLPYLHSVRTIRYPKSDQSSGRHRCQTSSRARADNGEGVLHWANRLSPKAVAATTLYRRSPPQPGAACSISVDGDHSICTINSHLGDNHTQTLVGKRSVGWRHQQTRRSQTCRGHATSRAPACRATMEGSTTTAATTTIPIRPTALPVSTQGAGLLERGPTRPRCTYNGDATTAARHHRCHATNGYSIVLAIQS
jgi:hypothetical protein